MKLGFFVDEEFANYFLAHIWKSVEENVIKLSVHVLSGLRYFIFFSIFDIFFPYLIFAFDISYFISIFDIFFNIWYFRLIFHIFFQYFIFSGDVGPCQGDEGVLARGFKCQASCSQVSKCALICICVDFNKCISIYAVGNISLATCSWIWIFRIKKSLLKIAADDPKLGMSLDD